MKNITIKDIAKFAGVGVSTVSRVMNNHPDVSKETRIKVDEIIKAYGYTPNNSARNLKITESNNIGVLIKGVSNPFFAKTIETIESQIVKKGYTMILQQVEPNGDEIMKANELIKEKRLAGVIFLGGSFSHSEESVGLLTAPFVFVTTTLLNCDNKLFSSVSVDDTKESFKATEHLISMGHRDIIIIVSEVYNHSVAELRLDGFKKALDENNIVFNPDNVIYADSYSMKSGYESIEKILLSKNKFTAVYAISDVLAIGACKALIDNGLNVPKDISIIGFDGQESTKYYNPSITTVFQPVEKMATKATEQLFKLMGGGNHKQYVFDGKLIKGASCIEIKT